MKRLLISLLLLAGISLATEKGSFVGSVSNLWPSYATTDALAELQAEFNSLINTNGITGEYADAHYLAIEWPNTNTTYTTTVALASTAIQPNDDATLNSLTFNATTNPPSEGQIAFIDEQGGLVIGMPGGGQLTVGAEGQTMVYNDTGVTLSNGCLVTFSGRQGNNPKVIKASATNIADMAIMGMVTTEAGIPTGHSGQATLWGLVRDVPNPNGYASGTMLYVSQTAGEFTNAIPEYPAEPFFVGKVEVATGGTMDIQLRLDGWKTRAMLDTRYQTKAYGSIYIHDGTNTLNITTTGVYYAFSNFQTNGSYNTTVTPSNIVIQKTGTYAVNQAVSFSGQPNTTYEGTILVNGAHSTQGEYSRKLGAGGDVGSAAGNALMYLTNGAAVSLGITGDTTGLVTPKQASLTVHKID